MAAAAAPVWRKCLRSISSTRISRGAAGCDVSYRHVAVNRVGGIGIPSRVDHAGSHAHARAGTFRAGDALFHPPGPGDGCPVLPPLRQLADPTSRGAVLPLLRPKSRLRAPHTALPPGLRVILREDSLMLRNKLPSSEDLNPQETLEWLQALDQVVDEAGPDRASYLLDRLVDRARVAGAAPAYNVNTPYLNTIAAEERGAVPGRPRNRAKAEEPDPLERARHGGTGEQVRPRHRRPHLDLRVAGHPARGRLQPLLPRVLRRAAGRSRLLPGALLSRSLCARVPGRAAERESTWRIFATSCASTRGCPPIPIRG